MAGSPRRGRNGRSCWERCRRIAGDKPSGGRHELVDRIERATRFPMLVVGIAWMVLAVIVLTIDVNRSASIVLVGSLFALWAVAFVEYDPESRVDAGGGNVAEGEDIEVLEVPIDEALAGIASGAIQDGKTIMLLQYARIHLFA